MKSLLPLAALSLCLAAPAFAHHNPMDGYDAKSPVVINGEVTKLDWTGEHVAVFLKAKDGKTWKVQAATPQTMRENGLDEAAFGAGDKVIVRGFRAIDKACKPDCLATGGDVTFPDGLKVKLDGTHAKDQGSSVHAQRIAARGKGG